MNAREEMLDRVRRALADVPSDERPAFEPRPLGQDSAAPSTKALADRFLERANDYSASVRRTTAANLAATVAEICRSHAAKRIALAPGLPRSWVPSEIEPIDGSRLDTAELDAVDGALTGCTLAIAETGTLVLDGGARCGARALTLVPDLHVCVVEEDQIVDGLPQALAALQPKRPITFVSGPSATSDIELDRVEGVHGPRRLEIVLLGGGS